VDSAAPALARRTDEPQPPTHPDHGITKSEHDKRAKLLAHRRQRRRVRTALASGVAEVITRREAGDVWSVAKDGQQCFDPRRGPQLMRT
jgi:hypothetical protein